MVVKIDGFGVSILSNKDMLHPNKSFLDVFF